MDWAVLANMSEDEKTLSSSLHLNQHKVNGALQDIRIVLLDLTKLSGQYDLGQMSDFTANRNMKDSPQATPLKPQSNLQKKALYFAERTRVFPRQIRWSAFDKKAFGLMLAKLTALNQNILYFFEQGQQEKHFQMQKNTFMGILQANNHFEDLLDVMASLNATSLYRHLPAHEQRLLQLARFKAFQVAVNESEGSLDEAKIRDYIGDSSTHANRILLDDHRYIVDADSDSLEYEPTRTWGTYETVPVWIDWRYCERFHPGWLLRCKFLLAISWKVTRLISST